MKLIDCIPAGRQNAVASKALAVAAGYKDVRSLQQDIRTLRLMGHPIVSLSEAPGGYFIENNPNELRRCARTLTSRANETLKVAGILANLADKTGNGMM